MKITGHKYYYYLLICLCCVYNNLSAQNSAVDSSYIIPFKRNNAVEVFTGVYSSSFVFGKGRLRRDDYRFKVNSSGYFGADITYKWLFLQVSFNIPGSALDRTVKFRYNSIRFRISSRKLIFQPFYHAYNGLLIPGEQRDRYLAFRDIRFNDAGFDLYYYTNTRKFSPRAANRFTEQQIRSAGSVFGNVTPIWQQINWKNPSKRLITDSATYSLLSSNPQWISLIARAGYTYNFVFARGKVLIAPAVLVAGGLLRELHTTNKKLQGITGVQAWLNAGYNGPVYYCYLNAFWNNVKTNLFLKDLHRTNTDVSITAGYRFHNHKKKFAGIL